MTRVADILLAFLVLTGMLLAGWLGVLDYGARQKAAGYALALDERARVDAAAVLARTNENAQEAARQAGSNATITEKKYEELGPVRERIVTQRVYVGSAVCGDRSATPTETESTASSDGANPPGRLVRADVERDLAALKLAVEEDLATGRACQAFVRENGLVP